MTNFILHIVYDDRCAKPDFLSGFGFSTLIYNAYSKEFSLFDTGGNGDSLVYNIERLGVKISEIKRVIISHNHHDHAGGLSKIIQLNPQILVYVPHAALASFKHVFPDANIQGISKFLEMEQGMYSSGEYGANFTEHCLYLQLDSGELIILVGCAHPGLENYIIKGREMGKIRAIIGGFHGFNKFSFLEGIEFIGACHCTAKMKEIAKRFPDQFKRICVGDSISF